MPYGMRIEVPELLELGMGDKTVFGDSVKVYMTPSMKVHLYLESKNYDNLRHMVGGRTFPDKELYSDGKRQEAFAQGKTIRLAPETVKKLVSDLAPEERELAALLERYYNQFAAERINKVSNALYGYDRAVTKNYAPIYTNSNYNQKEIGKFDQTAEGVGNMKQRIRGAKNPSYNLSAYDAFERHVDQTARFVGMAIPARNWKTLLNWKERNDSMSDVITHKWGNESLKYITDLLTDLQGRLAAEGTIPNIQLCGQTLVELYLRSVRREPEHSAQAAGQHTPWRSVSRHEQRAESGADRQHRPRAHKPVYLGIGLAPDGLLHARDQAAKGPPELD